MSTDAESGLNEWQIIGIDPAPTKVAVVYSSTGWQTLAPTRIREFLEERVTSRAATLIAWDAPLSFDRSDYYDRAVDKVVRAWAATNVRDGRFEERAINARCFAGLPHWVVSCATLGMPFGTPLLDVGLAPDRLNNSSKGAFVIEVHPAVALGAWWLSSNCAGQLPRYKGNASACKRIAIELGFPHDSGRDDDHLDSFVAHQIGELYVQGRAHWLGSAMSGGYVMPDCVATAELQNQLSRRLPPI